MEREQGVGVWKVERPLVQSGTKQLEFTFLSIGAVFYRIIYLHLLYSIWRIKGVTYFLYRM